MRQALFKMPQKDAVQLLKSAQSLGKQWYNVYMQVRLCNKQSTVARCMSIRGL